MLWILNSACVCAIIQAVIRLCLTVLQIVYMAVCHMFSVQYNHSDDGRIACGYFQHSGASFHVYFEIILWHRTFSTLHTHTLICSFQFFCMCNWHPGIIAIWKIFDSILILARVFFIILTKRVAIYKNNIPTILSNYSTYICCRIERNM